MPDQPCPGTAHPTDDLPSSDLDRAASFEELGLFRLSQIRSRQIAWLWRGRLPLGKLTILEGDPGLGKSTLLLDLAARLTTARPLPDDPAMPDAPASVLLISAEDSAADTIRPRLQAAGAELSRVLVWSHLPASLGGGLPYFPSHLSWVERMVEQFHPSLVVIDPLVAYLDPRFNAHSDQSIRQILTPFANLAESAGIAIVVVRHLNKQPGRNPLYRGGGSISLIATARSTLLVAADPDDPTGQRRILVSAKSNLGQLPSALAFRLVPSAHEVATIAWDGPTHHTAADLTVAPEPTGAPTSALAEALSILGAILADGPVPAREAQRQALQAGLSPSLLRRARTALGVRSRRVARPGAPGPGWLWELPAVADDVLALAALTAPLTPAS